MAVVTSQQIVPYGPAPTPTVTPPQGSFTQGDQPQIGGQPSQSPDQVKQLLQMLLSQQQKPQLAQPVPAPIPGVKQPAETGQGPSWGFERFANNVGGHIQQAVAQKKQADLAKAESDWNQLSAVMSQDPQKAQLWLAQNDKAAKNMAKALNQDWLNPEKTTVYKQALDNVMKQQQAKGKAATGLKAMMQKLIGKAQNPQLTDAQKMQIAQEQMSKAPLTTPGVDTKGLQSELVEAMKEESADKREQEKEEAAQKKQDETEQFNAYRDEQKQKFTEWSDTNKQQFQEHMETMKEKASEQRQNQHDIEMMKALGIKLADSDAKRMQITPSQINTEINSSLTSMRQQLTQSASQLKSLQTAAQKRDSSLWQKMISSSPDVSGAQSQVDNMKQAIDYIEKNRGAVISGKMPLDDVIDQAQTIASGTPPGFK